MKRYGLIRNGLQKQQNQQNQKFKLMVLVALLTLKCSKSSINTSQNSQKVFSPQYVRIWHIFSNLFSAKIMTLLQTKINYLD